LVTQALEAAGTASVRRRKLPAERGVWLMLGMALLRDKLGTGPLKHLFDAVVTRHGHEQLDAHRWRCLAVLGIDGMTIRVPESEVRRAHFTLFSSGAYRESAYPQTRVVDLMALRSYFLLKIGA
jgi:hypothetical protein